MMKIFKVAELMEPKLVQPQQFFNSLNLLRFLQTIYFVLCCILSKLPFYKTDFIQLGNLFVKEIFYLCQVEDSKYLHDSRVFKTVILKLKRNHILS